MHLQNVWWLMLIGAGFLVSPASGADLLSRVNQLRLKECTPSSPTLPALRRSTGLDAVAQEWSKGKRLADAVARTTYFSNKLASMQVKGTAQDAQIATALRESYCGILTDARYSEVGLFRQGTAVWIVVAAPLVFPQPSAATQLRERVLELVNQARSSPRTCGSAEFIAVKPLRASPELDRAAQAHAIDMAQQLFFRHQGSDGSDPGQRATRAGYLWSTVGENIAAGMITAEEVVQGWLDSPGHCANIMRPQFTQMGLAYATSPGSQAGIYWSQVLARPRELNR